MAQGNPTDRFGAFTVHNIAYKTVNSTPIETTILIPKSTKPGKHPLLVRWHGGFLIAGSRLQPHLLHAWMLSFALKHSAIFVLPDYRLIPESTGLDILEDVADFWKWTREVLPGLLAGLAPGTEVDLRDVAVIGESSGGYLATQSALLHPEVGLKAVIAAYPVLDITSPFFTEVYPKTLLGIAPGQLPEGLVDQHLAKTAPGTVIADATPFPERRMLAIAIIQTGRYLDILGREAKLQAFRNLETFKGDLPFIFTYHGRQDSAVPVEGTKHWEQWLRKVRTDGKWKVTYEDGEHGLDADATLETRWLREGLEDVEKYWP